MVDDMRGIGLSNKDAVLLWSMVLLVSMASVGAASDWPQFQKNETNFGCTDDKAPLGVNFAWRAPTNSAVDVVPVVGDDSVFILPKNNYVYSVNTTTGVRNWRTSTALNTGTGPWTNALSTPAYDEGNNSLYVATAGTNARVHAINATTGATIWNISIKKHDGNNEDGQPNTPVLFYNNSTASLLDDVVIFGTWKSNNRTYYCYNATNGDPIWNRTSTHSKGYYWAGAALIDDYLVYGENSGYLTSVEWKNVTNDNVWTEDEVNIGNNKAIKSSIAWNATNATYGHLFFTNSSGYKLTKIGFSTSTGDFNPSDWSNNHTRYSTSTPAVYDGRVYVGGGNFSTGGSSLLCINESDTSEQYWAFAPNGAVQSSPAVSIQDGDAYIYFTTNCKNGSFYCVKDNGSSADEQWNFSTLETGETSGEWWFGAQLQGVSISDNWVYGGNDGGYVYGLSNTTPDAYRKQNNTRPPTTCDVPDIEFTATQYANIRVDDEDRQDDETDAAGNFAAHRFNFSIDTPVANVTAINVSWTGIGNHDNLTAGANLSIWNFTSGAYELLQSGPTNSNEVTLAGNRTSGISSYINSGNITVLAQQKSAQSGNNPSYIETNYVKVIITTA